MKVDRFSLYIQSDLADGIRSYCQERGLALNTFFAQAAQAYLDLTARRTQQLPNPTRKGRRKKSFKPS